MPNVFSDLQRKYRYSVAFNWSADPLPDSSEYVVDEFTPPTRTRDVATAHNRLLGQVNIQGPLTLGPFTLKIALRVSDEDHTNAELINSLQSAHLYDYDTVTVVLTMTRNNSGETEVPTYTQTYMRCRVVSYQIDPLSRTSDDSMIHLEAVFQPRYVTELQGPEIDNV